MAFDPAAVHAAVRRGIEALDRAWPGWWIEWFGMPLSITRVDAYLAYERGCRRMPFPANREHGVNWFYTDETDESIAAFSAVIRGRRACDWESGAWMLSRLWEIDL